MLHTLLPMPPLFLQTGSTEYPAQSFLGQFILTIELSLSARVTRRSGISAGKSRRQKFSIEAGDSCSCVALTTSGVATALARGKRSRSDARPKKWSPVRG
jgi:hypothetical protein